MINIQKFTFNPFSENTYVLYREKEGIVVDPGMFNVEEQEQFKQFVADKNLKLTRCLLTHCHIDHVLGNKFILDEYGLKPEYHEEEQFVMDNNDRVSAMYGIPYTPSPDAKGYIDTKDEIVLQESQFETRFVPGHAPGHLVFINHQDKFVIAGDTLFKMSIGRTDLPGGNHEQLLEAIKNQLYTLDDDYVVYCGHGPETTIGFEKKNNPYVKA